QPPPNYFSKNAKLNKMGYESIDTVMERGARALSPREFEVAANETAALVLDVRSKEAFVKGFIPNSIFIGLDGSFAPWVGALIADIKQPILIVAPKGKNKEVVKRLARVGYDNAIGYLEGGFEAWEAAGKEIDELTTLDGASFIEAYHEEMNILDVRRPSEHSAEHLEIAQNLVLDTINAHMSEISKEKKYYVHCRTGYRSTIATSILRARGFKNLVNLHATFEEMAASKIPTTVFVCPSTLK
ncbi:MAG: rhodanese-like domain-containing protein, partial [Saprospiraceae bacterium]